MKLRTLLVAVSAVAASVTVAHAAPIAYKGTLVSAAPATKLEVSAVVVPR